MRVFTVLCAGLKYGFDNKNLPSQTYTETIYDIFRSSGKEGSISVELTKQRWDRLASDPVMSEFLGPALLAQVVDAIKEQYSHWDIGKNTNLWTAKVCEKTSTLNTQQHGI